MEKIYRAKLDDEKFNKLVGDLGYYALSPHIFKDFVVDYGSNASQSVKWMLNDKKWQDTFMKDKKVVKYLKGLGVIFRKGQVVENEDFKKFATDWRLEIDTSEDNWLSITCNQELYPFHFYKKDLMLEYCKEEIEKLLELDIIEEIEVEE